MTDILQFPPRENAAPCEVEPLSTIPKGGDFLAEFRLSSPVQLCWEDFSMGEVIRFPVERCRPPDHGWVPTPYGWIWIVLRMWAA